MDQKLIKGLKDGERFDYFVSDECLRDSKVHLGDLPVMVSNGNGSDVWRYPHSNRCAFVYSIFGSDRRFGGHLSQLYAKMSIYSALSFLRNTDLRECGIPVYFLVNKISANDILPFFEVAGVPMDNLILFDTGNIWCNAIKQVSQFVDELRHFERVICIDTDLYFHRPPDDPVFPMFANLLSGWERAGTDILIALGYSTDGFFRDWVFGFIKRTLKCDTDAAWQYLESVSGPGMRERYESADMTKPLHPGYINGYTQAIRHDDNIKRWMLEQAPVVWSDAHLVKLLLHKLSYPPVYAQDTDDKQPYRMHYKFMPDLKRSAVVHPRGNESGDDYQNWRHQWHGEMEKIKRYANG